MPRQLSLGVPKDLLMLRSMVQGLSRDPPLRAASSLEGGSGRAGEAEGFGRAGVPAGCGDASFLRIPERVLARMEAWVEMACLITELRERSAEPAKHRQGQWQRNEGKMCM